MRKPRLNKELAAVRRMVIQYTWDRFRSGYTMKELAQIFNMDLGNFFREVKKGYPIRRKPTIKQVKKIVEAIKNEI